MQLVLVGTRKGQANVHWPGVVATSALVCLFCGGASLLTYFLLSGTLSLFAALSSTIPALFGIVVVGVRRALQLPPDQLRPLD